MSDPFLNTPPWLADAETDDPRTARPVLRGVALTMIALLSLCAAVILMVDGFAF